MKKFLKRFTIACSLFLLCLPVMAKAAANGSGSFSYNSHAETGYEVMVNATDKRATAVLALTDEVAGQYFAYCADSKTDLVPRAKYTLANLEDSTYFDDATAQRIRAILRYSYPFASIGQIQTASNMGFLQQDAITAAQLALWKLINGETYTPYFYPSNAMAAERVTKLRDWYLALPGRAPAPSGLVAHLDFTHTFANGVLDIGYRADQKNADDTAIALTCTLPAGVTGTPGATDANGYQHITVNNPTFPFRVNVVGTQMLPTDAYLYQPVGGQGKSQTMVGILDGALPLALTVTLSQPIPENVLQITKIDSATGKPIANVEFLLSQDATFAGATKTLTTDANGVGSVDGMAVGTWYIKEKTTPANYLPLAANSTVVVGTGITKVTIKNTPAAELKIFKKNEAGTVFLPDAVFSIYEGRGTTGKLLYDDLKTNAEGLVVQGGLPAGIYTIVEKQAPPGYEKLGAPVEVELAVGERKELIFRNRAIAVEAKGTLHLFKYDAETPTLQLAGATYKIYRDEQLTDLAGTLTTFDQAAAVLPLAVGIYYIQEAEVPTGYLLDTTPKRVEIKDGQITEVSFYNTKAIVTGTNDAALLLEGLTLLGVCCLAWGALAVRKRNAK